MPETPPFDLDAWIEAGLDLAHRIRLEVRQALAEAFAAGADDTLARPVGHGAGDVTFGIDEVSERVVSGWLSEQARAGPLSLLTEDAGWRHVGPGVSAEAGFAHGGPRIAVDPIDGTRNIMNDLRPAWTVISIAPPGEEQPRYRDLCAGVLGEIPDTRAARFRELKARRGAGCQVRLASLATQAPARFVPLVADHDDRVDHGYFPFFGYSPDLRPVIAQRAAEFFARLERDEGADTRHCFDDQYISSGGQLALTALGSHRMVVEMRDWVARAHGRPTVTAKPYDMAGAALCAQEAGCIVTALDGEELDFPIDVSTPVSFVGYANRETAQRLQPHLDAALAER